MKNILMLVLAISFSAILDAEEGAWRKVAMQMRPGTPDVIQVNKKLAFNTVTVMPTVLVTGQRINEESWLKRSIQRMMVKTYSAHAETGSSSRSAMIVADDNNGLLPDLFESAVATGNDLKKLNGLYDIKSNGETVGTIHFKGEFMYTPKGSDKSYGLKTVRHGVLIIAISKKF